MSKRIVKSHENPAPAFRSPLWRRLVIGFLLLTVTPVAVLQWVPPPMSMFMIIAKATALFHGDTDFRIHYRWASWQDIAPTAKLAVVAAEDQRFVRHLGFDVKAMQEAYEHNRKNRQIRGGSTISQQTAKNLFLYPGRSYLRKILEAYFTGLIELFWRKQRILEMYLNIAQFGDGVYGVGAASQTYFGKPPSALTAREAALLAAVLPNPVRLRVEQPSAYLRKRQSWILGQMQWLRGQQYLEDL